jgi:hypothetical protein
MKSGNATEEIQDESQDHPHTDPVRPQPHAILQHGSRRWWCSPDLQGLPFVHRVPTRRPGRVHGDGRDFSLLRKLLSLLHQRSLRSHLLLPDRNQVPLRANQPSHPTGSPDRTRQGPRERHDQAGNTPFQDQAQDRSDGRMARGHVHVPKLGLDSVAHLLR